MCDWYIIPNSRNDPAALGASIGPDVIIELQSLHKALRALWPFNELELQIIGQYSHGYVGSWEDPMPKIIWSVWRPWFYKSVVHTSATDLNMPPERTELIETPTEPLRMEVVAAISGAVERLCLKHAVDPPPLRASARRRAHKALAYYYECDTHLPLFDGRSIEDIADSFFDEQQVQLDDPTIVWFADSSNRE
jgi:hypothetical protein